MNNIWKRVRNLIVFAFVASLLLVGSKSHAETTTGFLMPNAWFDGTTSGDPLDPPDGVNWTFNFPWFMEPNVFSGAAGFKTESENLPGFYALEGSPGDLTLEPNVTSLAGYDPNTTELTGLTFHDPWRVAHFGTVPTDGDYNYSIEFTIETPAGFYRASSQKLSGSTVFQNSIAQVGFVFSWEEGSFLGDPFTGGNGIPLNQINNMDYNVLMEVITPTTSGDGFFLVEGFNLEYEVNSDSPSLAADFDGDNDVDGDDLAVWETSYGVDAGADADGDLDSDGLDFLVWQSEFGNSIPSLTAATTNVPEPSSLVLLVGGLASVTFLTRR